MIILAVGMPRAGSGWHYNLTHDLMLTAGATDAREIRRRFRLGRILTEVNCNIGVLSLPRLGAVLIPSIWGNTFTIKLHAGPTPFARTLIQRGQIRPTFIYRDPRDALLSAYEYGQRTRAAGRENAFSPLDTLEKAITFIAEYVDYWERWTAIPNCHAVSYESLKTDYPAEATRLTAFLGLDAASPPVRAVIEKYQPDEARKADRGVHFVKGISGRFRDVLSPEQQQLCINTFGETLVKMGYPP
ncbi:MAG: sulfotransferase domain-containing protein [Anaerolineae bacterium]|nr:sulfotransferase domain-containing protein [Anaerolineae bacterium]